MIKKIYANEDDCKNKGIIGYWDSKVFHVTSNYNSGIYTPAAFVKDRMKVYGSNDSILAAAARQIPQIRVLFKDLMKTCKSKYKEGQTVAYTHGFNKKLELGVLKKLQYWKMVCIIWPKNLGSATTTRMIEMWTLVETSGREISLPSDNISDLGDFDKWQEGKKIALEAKKKIKATGCRGFQIIYEGKSYKVN